MSLYKRPMLLSEVVVREVPGGPQNDPLFQIVHIQDIINVRATSISEKQKWMTVLADAFGKYQTVLRNQQSATSQMPPRTVGMLQVNVWEGSDLMPADQNGKSDPFCEVRLDSQMRRTKTVAKTLSPKWSQSLSFGVVTLDSILKLTVYDHNDFAPNVFLGSCQIPIDNLEYWNGKETERMTVMLSMTNKEKKSAGSVVVSLLYKPNL